MSNNGNNVIRVLMQRIDDGDIRKILAKSNDSPSGGGARDLRFRPETEFLPFFKRMFSDIHTKVRKTKGKQTVIEILSGTVIWNHDGSDMSQKVEIWPSTDSRPNECRLAKVNGLKDLIKNSPSGGRSVLMLFQLSNGTIRLYFTNETSLKNDDWNPKIKEFASDWFESNKKSAYLELESKKQYPNG